MMVGDGWVWLGQWTEGRQADGYVGDDNEGAGGGVRQGCKASVAPLSHQFHSS